MQGPPQSAEEEGGGEDVPIFAEINITPLTDVFLVLLIIFMVVASSMVEAEKQAAAAKNLLAERALQVMTPQGTGDTPLVPKDVVISVLPDGSIIIEDEQTTLDGLDAKLAEVKRGAASTRVVIRGDETARYDLIMKVISKARTAGLTDVALASRAHP
jgi:biopolymer transport protein ExbD